MIYIFKIIFYLLERQFGQVVKGAGRGAMSEAGGVSSRHGAPSSRHPSAKEISLHESYNNRDKVTELEENEVKYRHADDILGNTATSGFGLKKKDMKFTNA